MPPGFLRLALLWFCETVHRPLCRHSYIATHFLRPLLVCLAQLPLIRSFMRNDYEPSERKVKTTFSYCLKSRMHTYIYGYIFNTSRITHMHQATRYGKNSCAHILFGNACYHKLANTCSPSLGNDGISRHSKLVPGLLQEQVLALHLLRQKTRGRATRQLGNTVSGTNRYHHDGRAWCVCLQAAVSALGQ